MTTGARRLSVHGTSSGPPSRSPSPSPARRVAMSPPASGARATSAACGRHLGADAQQTDVRLTTYPSPVPHRRAHTQQLDQIGAMPFYLSGSPFPSALVAGSRFLPQRDLPRRAGHPLARSTDPHSPRRHCKRPAPPPASRPITHRDAPRGRPDRTSQRALPVSSLACASQPTVRATATSPPPHPAGPGGVDHGVQRESTFGTCPTRAPPARRPREHRASGCCGQQPNRFGPRSRAGRRGAQPAAARRSAAARHRTDRPAARRPERVRLGAGRAGWWPSMAPSRRRPLRTVRRSLAATPGLVYMRVVIGHTPHRVHSATSVVPVAPGEGAEPGGDDRRRAPAPRHRVTITRRSPRPLQPQTGRARSKRSGSAARRRHRTLSVVEPLRRQRGAGRRATSTISGREGVHRRHPASQSSCATDSLPRSDRSATRGRVVELRRPHGQLVRMRRHPGRSRPRGRVLPPVHLASATSLPAGPRAAVHSHGGVGVIVSGLTSSRSPPPPWSEPSRHRPLLMLR